MHQASFAGRHFYPLRAIHIGDAKPNRKELLTAVSAFGLSSGIRGGSTAKS
jgi:hypothetical protein